MDTTAEQPYAKINELLNPMSNPGHNRYDCGSTRIHRSGKFIAQTWANQAHHLQSQPELGFGLIGFVYFTLPSFESKDMAFSRHSIHWPFVVEITWDGRPDLVSDARDWAKDLIAITRQGADDPSEIGYPNWGEIIDLGGQVTPCATVRLTMEQRPKCSPARVKSRKSLEASTTTCNTSRRNTIQTWSSTSGSLSSPLAVITRASGAPRILISCRMVRMHRVYVAPHTYCGRVD